MKFDLFGMLLLGVGIMTAAPELSEAQKSGDKIETCARQVGTLAVLEPEDKTLTRLKEAGLAWPAQLIRTLVQRTNCYQIVERGAALSAMTRERELAQSGGLQKGSNVGSGQMKAADFILTPTVELTNPDAGGAGGLIGGILRGKSAILGAVAGGVKSKQAQTSILITDTRSGVQVASAEGKATKHDFALGGLGLAGTDLGGVGGYTSTAEGKVIAASFLDNLNNIVVAIREDKGLARVDHGGSNEKAEVHFEEGDVVEAKIDNVRILAEAREASRVVASLRKSDEAVALGEEKDGYVHVQAGAGEGWAKKSLLKRK
jgi:hypothetical protein